MAYGEIPRGIEDLKVAALSGDTPGSSVDVPGVRSLTWNVESDSDDLEGDNAIIATVRNPKSLTGSIEIGRINLAALAAMVGGTVGTSGTTPSEIKTLSESSASSTNYFQATGQAPSQDSSGSAYRALIKKALVTSGPNESMTVNEWSTPTLDFTGVAISGVLMVRSNYETSVALT